MDIYSILYILCTLGIIEEKKYSYKKTLHYQALLKNLLSGFR